MSSVAMSPAGRGRPQSLPARIEAKVLVLLAAVAVGVVVPPPATAYTPDVHSYVADQALALYSTAELDANRWWIRHGAEEEDIGVDHVYGYHLYQAPETWPLANVPMFAHFWDSDGAGAANPDDELSLFGLDWPNAWQKARRLWAIGLGEYRMGRTSSAYHYLGHVAHLLGDMSVPAHVHDDAHVFADDAYEKWMEGNHALTDAQKARLIAAGPIEIPADQPEPLFWLFETTNQTADFFASDDANGDAVDPEGWIQDKLTALAGIVDSPLTAGQLSWNDDGNHDQDGDLSRIRTYSYLNAVRATAALYRLFDESVHTRLATVVINRVSEDNSFGGWHDGPFNEPDYYARVRVNSGEGGRSGIAVQNVGDQQTGDVIEPDWAFAMVLGPETTQLDVEIEIWDYDEFIVDPLGPDDQSDITPKSGKALDLSVDVATCLAGEAGAITPTGNDAGTPFRTNGDGRCNAVTMLDMGGDGWKGSRISFTILVSQPTSTALTVSPDSQQYSDTVALAAAISPATATGSVQFQASTDGSTYADIGGPVPVIAGSAVLPDAVVVADAAGTPVRFWAAFTGSGGYADSSGVSPLTVVREDAAIGFASDNPVALEVSSPGSGSWSGTLTLGAMVRERQPDLAGSGTAAPGDVAHAGLSMSLVPIGGGSTLALVCAPGAVSGAGYARIQSFACSRTGPVPLGTYEVVAAVTGAFYAGTAGDALTVADPSLGFATGGGTYAMDGDDVSFGFTLKYNKSRTNLQGNVIVVRHHDDGTISRLKSNVLGGLAIQSTAGCGIASFNGKATWTAWDPAASGGSGAYVQIGNQPFAIQARDCGEPGIGTDAMWIMAPGDLATGGDAQTGSRTLNGGNVAVPQRGTP